MALSPRGRTRALKSAVWTVCLLPIAWLAYRYFFGGGLGANPIEELEHWSGLTGLTVLLGTLAVTPLRRISGWNELQKVRRLTGLFAFFYVCVHLLIYVGLDQFFGWTYIVEDVLKRRYIFVGAAAFALLVPLAVTSTRGWIRRLGSRWVRLHRLVYVAASLGVLHFFWKEKADTLRPWYALTVLLALFAVRMAYKLRTILRSRSPERRCGPVAKPATGKGPAAGTKPAAGEQPAGASRAPIGPGVERPEAGRPWLPERA